LAGRAEGIPLQAEAVGHHEQRGQRHGGGGDDRIEVAERGERDRGRVVPERPREVEADGAEGRAGKPDRVGDRAQVIPQQDHVGRPDGDVGAGAEGEAKGRRGERGTVVDAVADHGHPGAAVL